MAQEHHLRSPLQKLLSDFRDSARSEREKGDYFEKLILCYLRHEATYKDLYSDVWSYTDWARGQGLDSTDTGIDLVARTRDTEEMHAIQCKFYTEDHSIQKQDIDSFFTASGQRPFVRRIIVATTNRWGANAEAALFDQQPPVTKIDLHDLENSQIDWGRYQRDKKPVLHKKKELRPHQRRALEDVTQGLEEAERGKLIMACGTGKTFVSLKIAEAVAGEGGRVLFLVPSLALLSQALTEWTQESQTPLHSFAVCSDRDVGKKRRRKEDVVQTYAHELRYPATTEPGQLARALSRRHDAAHMSVVFGTYQSIEVVADAQRKHSLEDFDLIICDEAHRTTGATLEGEDESHFVKVHDKGYIRASRRIYMTATPRLYADSAKAKAEREDITLCSMDDENLYGRELHVLNFSEAVSRDLLVDYKVIVLAVDEAHVSRRLQSMLADGDNQLRVDDAAKIIGCWKALAKEGQDEELTSDARPMRRAVAFCQVIEKVRGARTHKVSSKHIASMFQQVVAEYQEQDREQEQEQEETRSRLVCEVEHIDGTMNASEKEAKLQWLKEETTNDNLCRVLSNVRCLSEGVDVPALDAVLFLTPRSSQVDVVQSVGRVMRKASGKERGYIILPVVIPAGVEPSKALDDNRAYRVVWQVLQALRSHDDRFDAFVNKLELVGSDNRKMEVIAVADQIGPKQKRDAAGKRVAGKGGYAIGEAVPVDYLAERQSEMSLEIGEIERALYAKVVKKCGNRLYWDKWAGDIAKIAETHITRITTIVENPENTEEVEVFNEFAAELRDDLNASITDEEVIEMLAQHLITKPVFDALFEDYEFAARNPVSRAMQKVLDLLQEHHLDTEAETLEKFYASVRMRAEGIDKAEGKQKIMAELYNKFFRGAFQRTTKRLGIVYTPVEVVDFIIHSVHEVLQREFGQTLGSRGVHILDPFVGTGTFITRLLQSGLITPEELSHKYQSEIHANEIVLLAYYIAAVNIEAAYHGVMGGEYVPFEGICLTDTFQMHESDDMVDALMPDNSERRKRQKELDIQVIMSNPPYSAGQRSANDNAQNVAYPELDEKINQTYVKHSTATLSRNLYDSYIRAIRWGTNRIGEAGVMAYVTNAGWIDGNAMDRLRKCLAEEFSSLYVFHLRGNQRTSGETSRREGGQTFGGGSRAPIAVTLFVKNPAAREHGKIHFHDIGDYLSREQKLETIRGFESIRGIEDGPGWRPIVPDKNNDWLNQVDPTFDRFVALGDKRDKSAVTVFENFSLGVATNRDAWCYNASRSVLKDNIQKTMDFFNAEIARYQLESADGTLPPVDSFIRRDTRRISWTRALKKDLERKRRLDFSEGELLVSAYRPFSKQWMYYGRRLNEVVSQMRQIFPGAEAENKVICVTGIGSLKGLSALMCDVLPDLNMLEAGAQCFPLKLYKKTKAPDNSLFSKQNDNHYQIKDGITDAGLAHFQAAWPDEKISKDDLFHYIYGLLHSPDYRKRYKNNLSKQIPRIPAVKRVEDYRAFLQAGRKLAELHLHYENVEPWPVTINDGNGLPQGMDAERLYRVEKMKFGGTTKDKDQTTVIYNPHVTISDVPLEAYDYVVNGKPALAWVMERQRVKTDQASGIVNDPNRYATETLNNPAYPLELFQRIIQVSIETMKIVNNLPPLDTP